MIIRDVEVNCLLKHNYVFMDNGFVCITSELWGKLINLKGSQDVINSLKEQNNETLIGR